MKYDSAENWDCGIDTRFCGPINPTPANDYIPTECDDFDDAEASECEDDEATRVAKMKEVFGW